VVSSIVVGKLNVPRSSCRLRGLRNQKGTSLVQSGEETGSSLPFFLYPFHLRFLDRLQIYRKNATPLQYQPHPFSSLTVAPRRGGAGFSKTPGRQSPQTHAVLNVLDIVFPESFWAPTEMTHGEEIPFRFVGER